MKSIARILVIALSIAACGPLAAQNAGEAAVQEFMARLDRALAAKNAADVGKLITDNAEFSGTFVAGGRTRSVKVNKEQYIAALRDGWAQASNYVYRRTNEQIALSGSKATVTADVFESMILQGQYIQLKSKGVWTLEKINGAYLLTAMDAKGSMRGAQ